MIGGSALFGWQYDQVHSIYEKSGCKRWDIAPRSFLIVGIGLVVPNGEGDNPFEG